MKIILIIIAVILVISLIANISLAIKSQKMPDTLGLKEGELGRCPDTPNCVCSEKHSKDDKIHFIEPLRVRTEKRFNELKQVIIDQGGTIITDEPHYMHATFTSTIFRFVDDVEVRYVPEKKTAHIRSASRMGHSDFGVNRKRVEKIRIAYE